MLDFLGHSANLKSNSSMCMLLLHIYQYPNQKWNGIHVLTEKLKKYVEWKIIIKKRNDRHQIFFYTISWNVEFFVYVFVRYNISFYLFFIHVFIYFLLFARLICLRSFRFSVHIPIVSEPVAVLSRLIDSESTNTKKKMSLQFPDRPGYRRSISGTMGGTGGRVSFRKTILVKTFTCWRESHARQTILRAVRSCCPFDRIYTITCNKHPSVPPPHPHTQVYKYTREYNVYYMFCAQAK